MELVQTLAKQKRGIKLTIGIIVVFITLVLIGFINKITTPRQLNDIELKVNGAFVFDNPRMFKPFSLLDHHGDSFEPASLEGKWSLVFFGFTHCPDVCPTTMATLAKLMKNLDQEVVDETQVVLVSVDPARDTPEVLAKYVPYFNHKYGKSGTLWEGRFKGCMIESEQYLLCCYRYIELNPVRANMVKKPEEWKWSSYACNAYGESNKLIKPHKVYLAIDKDNKKRVDYYRESFKQVLDSSLIEDLRSAVQTGTPLGNDRFKEEVEELLGVKVGYARRGRPKNRG